MPNSGSVKRRRRKDRKRATAAAESPPGAGGAVPEEDGVQGTDTPPAPVEPRDRSVWVKGVVAGSPAQTAGLRVGDVILGLGEAEEATELFEEYRLAARGAKPRERPKETAATAAASAPTAAPAVEAGASPTTAPPPHVAEEEDEEEEEEEEDEEEEEEEQEQEETEEEAEDEEDLPIYEVEDLTEQKRISGKDYYLVKWKGFDEASWEPDENIGKELDSFKEAARRKGSKRGPGWL